MQPQAQRDMAGLEDGSDLDGEGFAAVVAFVGAYAGALATHLSDALHATAMRAYRPTRPKARLYEFIRGFFIMEVGGGKNGLAHDCSPLLRTV